MVTEAVWPRGIARRLQEALADTPVVLLNGPRQCGKTTLVRQFTTEQRPYLTLDDATTCAAAREDPQGFIRRLDGAVIDEVQRVPELLLAIKLAVDDQRRPGRFLLTGSADVMALPRVADSLAGRVEVLSLLPLAASAAPNSQMKLAWSDEFNTPEIDATKWNVHNSVTIKDGKANLNLLPGKEPGLWISSTLNSARKFTQVSGYFEASVRMLQTNGRTGRFEVRNASLDEPPSARLFFDGWGDDRIVPGAQVADNTGLRMLKPVKHGIDFDGGASYKKFHTYGVHWTSKYFEWYVDGKKVHRLELKTTPTTPMYVEFCHHTAEGGKVKDFMNPTNGPEPLQVDWVKVWK